MLINYGIQSEKSEYRMHVCFGIEMIYFFKVTDGLNIVKSKKYPVKPAYIEGIRTAEGCAAPWNAINGCSEIPIPTDILSNVNCKAKETTYSKGNKAIIVAKNMILRGLIPFNLNVREVEEKDLQIMGEDIIVKMETSIQVKCDYYGGSKELGGTGNLYLQIKEIHLKGIQN